MKQYPTQIFLTMRDPKTGKEEMRWFPVHSAEHETFLRNQVKNMRESIAKARERMAAAVGGEAQKMVVESLTEDFVEFYRKEQKHGVDGRRGEEGKIEGNGGQLHTDSEQERPVGPCGSGSGQEQGRQGPEKGADGAGVREGCEEPIAAA